MQNPQDKTIKDLGKDCRTVEDVHEMLKNLFKDTIQQIFEAELDEQLRYKKHSTEGIHSGNSRNGYSKKTVKTNFGNTDLAVPRDRNGEYEPQIKKYETTLNGLEGFMLKGCLPEINHVSNLMRVIEICREL